MCEDHGFFWMIYELAYYALQSQMESAGPAVPNPPDEQNDEQQQGVDSRVS